MLKRKKISSTIYSLVHSTINIYEYYIVGSIKNVQIKYSAHINYTRCS